MGRWTKICHTFLSSSAMTFVFIPFAVMPWFLDFAQGAKKVALGALGAWLMWRMARRAWRDEEFADACRRLLPILICGAMFLLLVLIAKTVSVGGHAIKMAWSSYLYTSWSELAAWMVAGALALSLRRQHVLPMLFVGSSAIAAFGLLQMGLDWRVLMPASDPGQFPATFFGNRGFSSLYAALGIAPGLVLLRSTHCIDHKRWIHFGLLLCAGFVVLSMTRATWISLAVGLGVYIALRRRARLPEEGLSRWGWWLGILGLTGALVIGILLVNPDVRHLAMMRLNPERWFHDPRLALWQACLANFAKLTWSEQLFGVESSQFFVWSRSFVSQFDAAAPGRLYLDAHNDYLQWLVEFGVVGLAVRVLAILGLCRTVLVSLRTPSTRQFKFITALCANLSLLLINALLFYPSQVFYFRVVILVTALLILRDVPRQISPVDSPSISPLATLWTLRTSAVALALYCLCAAQLELGMKSVVSRDLDPFSRIAVKKDVEVMMRYTPSPEFYRFIARMN